ncbi:MAG: MMPL family transporter [Rhodocyclaceae bacterium]|jgi:predicted RND superfamily exporter protein|nr:MMPL family transporter [Rhodocyclaceae bacterium]
MASKHIPQDMPVITRAEDFDEHSGMWLERFVFNHRLLVLAICVLMTSFLGWHALKLPVNASFDDMIPQSHPYIKNYFENRDSLRGMGNTVRIAVENTRGTIFDRDYLLQLQKINDAVYLLPGVDRGYMRGLWTTSLRWTEVTEEGFQGGPVMPKWSGNPNAIDDLKINIAKAGIVGSFVANDMKSSMILIPLVEKDPETGEALDYAKFGQLLDDVVKQLETDDVKIHVVGFAKLVHDLITGLYDVMQYFAISALIATAFVFSYTRCIRSTLLLCFSALLGVVWLLGLLQLFGYVLNPYSILVPFLIFAVGLSHGAQKMNGIMQDVGRGTHKYVAARYTFRRLFMAGLTALVTNIVGFAVLAIIDIPAIREMAVTTSIGVTVLIFTKLMLIPVFLSYTGVSKSAALRSLHNGEGRLQGGVRLTLASLTEPRRATIIVSLAAVLAVGAAVVGHFVQFGDLSPGAPELRPESVYNKDNAFITAHYGLSSDQFVVMIKAAECSSYDTVVEIDRLGAELREIEGVQTTFSLADGVRNTASSIFEGSPKWMTIPRNFGTRSAAFDQFGSYRPDLVDRVCRVSPLIAYLTDHKAGTLTRMVEGVEKFAAEHDTENRQFLLAAGSAGIEAITNIVVKKSFWTMHFVLYGAVILLCFVTFRSWRATLVALIPLGITSLLCEALMVWLGIGIKVATLPVIAVGVGVGVDYALYLLSIQLAFQRRGETLKVAYLHSLDFTGRIVALVGVTMAAGVITWAWSPIKFQVDMGILLAFMFLWNLVGALVLIPALSHFLLRTDADRAPSAVDEIVPQQPDVFSKDVDIL